MRQTPGSRFSKNAASHLSLDSCIRSSPHAADPENRNEENSPSFHSGIARPIRALPAPSQTSRDRPPCQRTFWRAAANERGGGEPAVRAVDAGGVGEGVCREVVTAKACGKYPMAPSKWKKTIRYYLIHHHIGSI